MEDFVYHNPVKVIFGRHALAALTGELSGWGEPVLLVYGCGSIKRTGLYQRLCAALKEAGIAFIEHGGVQTNPLLSHVHSGIDKVRSAGCTGVLTVGGGSVIDSGKAIAAGCCAAHDIWKCFTGKKSVSRCLPLLCIPTVAGSGSDMNSGMVLTHDQKQRKFGFAHRLLIPRVSLVDPSLTVSVPFYQTAWGAVDTLVHCLEVYLTGAIDQAPLQRRFLENICQATIAACRRLQADPQSYTDRATMLWAASLALSGITTAGLGRIAMPLHLLEHALSARRDLAHGAGLAALLPGWLRFRLPANASRLAGFGRQVFSIRGKDEVQAAVLTIEAFERFLREIDCPCSLAALGVAEELLTELVDHCREQARVWRLHEFTDEAIAAAYRSCLTGNPR
ncbi:MAG: iron-containing alcohol dehydrogenase [Desulfofustis sp.]|nr:iron-containing alcohol dehydrogenase [Desulfofustis sp.]